MFHMTGTTVPGPVLNVNRTQLARCLALFEPGPASVREPFSGRLRGGA